MSEVVKRLTPKGDTLRELFLKSGNLCAFPGCGHLMIDNEGIFIGQLCHIEAAEEGGERFNADMSNEDRRSFVNLMLMCYPHHQKTNDVQAFTPEKLRAMKAEHEQRFSRPDRAILEKLIDWTEVDVPTEVCNLERMNKALGWQLNKKELQQAILELNAYVLGFRNVPIELRRFLASIARRANKMKESRAVQHSALGIKLLTSDIAGVFRLDDRAIAERANQLDSYGLGDIDEIDTDLGMKPAVRIQNLESGWPLWLDIVKFCELEHEPLEVFTDDLNFARLDL